MYGTPDRPRLTIPSSLAPGSVVEIHGSGYVLSLSTNSGTRTSNVAGTATSPIFIRGTTTNQAVIRSTSNTYGLPFVMIDNPAAPNDARRPVITNFNSVGFGLAYLIIENLEFDMSTATDGIHFRQTSNHCAVRNCIIHGAPTNYGRDAMYLQTDSAWQSGDTISDIVFYHNKIGPNGEEPPTFESGIMGLGINTVTLRCWVLENYFYHNAEDNIHILAAGGHGGPAQFIYIGGNTFDGDGENAVDIKQSYDVIVSSNEMRNFYLTHWPHSGAAGEAIVFNDDTPSNRKWAINNVIHDCNVGVRSQSIGDNYVVGNVFFNIYHDPSKPLPTSPGHTSGVCVALSAFDSFHVINNTFDDVDGGVYVNNGNVTTIENNMFGSLKVPTTTWHQRLNNTVALTYPSVSNSFYLSPRRFSSTKAVDRNYLVGDPLFTNAAARDLSLQAGSPAIEAGKSADVFQTFYSLYGLNIAHDIRGTLRPDIGDIGAFQRSGR